MSRRLLWTAGLGLWCVVVAVAKTTTTTTTSLSSSLPTAPPAFPPITLSVPPQPLTTTTTTALTTTTTKAPHYHGPCACYTHTVTLPSPHCPPPAAPPSNCPPIDCILLHLSTTPPSVAHCPTTSTTTLYTSCPPRNSIKCPEGCATSTSTVAGCGARATETRTVTRRLMNGPIGGGVGRGRKQCSSVKGCMAPACVIASTVSVTERMCGCPGPAKVTVTEACQTTCQQGCKTAVFTTTVGA